MSIEWESFADQVYVAAEAYIVANTVPVLLLTINVKRQSAGASLEYRPHIQNTRGVGLYAGNWHSSLDAAKSTAEYEARRICGEMYIKAGGAIVKDAQRKLNALVHLLSNDARYADSQYLNGLLAAMGILADPHDGEKYVNEIVTKILERNK
jgi:hypothetical protein